MKIKGQKVIIDGFGDWDIPFGDVPAGPFFSFSGRFDKGQEGVLSHFFKKDKAIATNFRAFLNENESIIIESFVDLGIDLLKDVEGRTVVSFFGNPTVVSFFGNSERCYRVEVLEWFPGRFLIEDQRWRDEVDN